MSGVSRAVKSLVLVAVVVVVLAVGFKVLSGHGPDHQPTTGGSTTSVPAEPASAPGRGGFVDSEVTPAGRVVVQHWIRSSHAIRRLDLSTVDPDPSAAGARAVGVVVYALDGTVLGRADSVGAQPVHLALGQGAPNLYLSYQIEGGLDDASQTVRGRMLANVVGMDVDYSGASGPVVRMVHGPGKVINVACLRPSQKAGTPPFPCGAPNGDGWQVILRGIDRGDRLLVQLGSD